MKRANVWMGLVLGLLVGGCTAVDGRSPSDPGDPEVPTQGGDVTEPDDPTDPPAGAPEAQFRALSDDERAALQVALFDLGVVRPMAGTASDTAGEIRMVGPISFTRGRPQPATTTTTTTSTGTKTGAEYDGTGIQYEWSFGEVDDFLHTGVLAWKGLDVKAQTVDEVILVLVDGLVDAGTVDLGSFGSEGGIAIIWDQVAGETYFSDEGTFEITKIVFDSEEDCFDASKKWSSGFECTVSEGTLDGSLDVVVEDWFSSKSVQREAEFSVPATRVSLSFDHGGGSGGKGGTGSSSSSCSYSEATAKGSLTIECEDGDCTCTENGKEVGTCEGESCDPVDSCCAKVF